MTRFAYREIWSQRMGSYLKAESQILFLTQGGSDIETLNLFTAYGTSSENRSSKLRYTLVEDTNIVSRVAFDKLTLKGMIGKLTFNLGRNPIDLSKSWIFRPNDLFAPFRAHQFDREYKRGVDSARISYGVSNFSEFSLLGVAGYCDDSGSRIVTAESNSYCPELSSLLATVSTSLSVFQFDLFGGKNTLYYIGALGFAGDLLERLSISGDIKQAFHISDEYQYIDASVGADIRILDDLLLRLEYFYHGQGYDDVEDYSEWDIDPYGPFQYLGRSYFGFVGTYNYDPLTEVKLLFQLNITDSSILATIFFKRSIAQDKDLVFNFIRALGEPPRDQEIFSEYGSYPSMITVETNFYY
jgi:hypothetical protein